jgi:hypothetical protein
MKSIQQVREELAKVFEGVKLGTVNHKDAAELNNSAGKIISSLKVELEYYALRKEKPEIPFIDGEPKAK